MSLSDERLRSVKHSKLYNDELDKKEKARKNNAKKMEKTKQNKRPVAPPPPRTPGDDARYTPADSEYARPPREMSVAYSPPRGRSQAPVYKLDNDYRRPVSAASGRYPASSRHRSPLPPPRSRDQLPPPPPPRASSSRHQERPSRQRTPPPPPRSQAGSSRHEEWPSHHRSPPPPRHDERTSRHGTAPHQTYGSAHGAATKRRRDSRSPDPQKRQRVEGGGIGKKWRMRFSAGSSSVATKIWYASGFEHVDHPTRADEKTLRWDPTTELWERLSPGLTPILCSEDDRARYQREIHDFGYFGPGRGF